MSLGLQPPMRTKVSGVLAAVACAACCALPFLIAGGVVTAGAAGAACGCGEPGCA